MTGDEGISRRSPGSDGWLGGGMILAGLGLAANSLLGPLVAGRVEYPLSRTLVNQTVGLEAVSLVLVAPLCVAAGILCLRRHPGAAVFALSPSLYVAYILPQYVVGPDYLAFRRIVLLHLVLFVLGWVLAVRAWTTCDPAEVRRATRGREAVIGGALLLLAAFVVVRYLPGVLGAWSGEPIPSESRDDPAMFWTIVLLDLGVVVPATLAAAAGILSEPSVWARKAALGILGWFALVGLAVGAMGVAMYLDGDPNAEPGTVALLGAVGLVSGALGLWAHQPLLRRGEGMA